MSLQDQIKKLKKSWGNIAILSVWIGTVSSSLIFPLPNWVDAEDHGFIVRLVTFFSAVIAVFLLLYAKALTKKKRWLSISIISLSLFVASILYYRSFKGEYTLPYNGHMVVIGSVEVEPSVIDILKNDPNLSTKKENLLKHVHGDGSILWLKSSIEKNKNILISMYAVCYLFLSIFMVSFSKLIILKSEE